MPLALRFLNVPQHFHHEVRKCWRNADYPSLFEYAPYAAFVLTVKLFFYIALTANLISSERPSNHIDIAYLFYLPFCMMFVSNDRLHQCCAPLFLRNDQEFVWGQDLNISLSKINEHYLQLPESDKEKGIYSFASDLPQIEDSYIEDLWTRLLPKYRRKKEGDTTSKYTSNLPTLDKIKGMEDAPPLSPEEIDFDSVNVDQVLIKRQVRRRKGSWLQIPN